MKKTYLIITSLVLCFGASAQVDRVSLLETFTSSTCPPCNAGNVNLENLLADPVNNDKQVSLKYQVDWPGNGDPYYTDEGGIRKDLYVIAGVPATRLDGQTEYNPGNLTQSHLNTVYSVAPKADITAFYSVDEAGQTVDIQVNVEVLENTPPGVRLYAAIFEYETFNNVKSNGETEFFHVMKKMIPGASGIVMPPMQVGESYNFNESYTFQGSYTLPPDATSPIDHATEHSIEEFSDLGVAVWVQTVSTREVYQARYAQLSATGIEDFENSIQTAKIYPNPTSEDALVAFQATKGGDFTIETINGMGQVVNSELLENVEAGRTTHTLSTSNLKNGIYTIRISSAEGMISKRLSVID